MKVLQNIGIVLILLLFNYGSLNAQKGKGSYVVREGGDTLYGVFQNIKSLGSEIPKKLTFLPDSGNAMLILKPKDCRYVFIDATHIYLPYSGKRMTNPATSKGAFVIADADTPDRYKIVSVFLKKLVSTKYCDFYILNDARRMNLFYSIKGQPIQELICQVYTSGSRLIESDAYKQQLNTIFSAIISKDNLIGVINNMEYTEEDFIRLANTVNAIK
jgi:hypothetical protein